MAKVAGHGGAWLRKIFTSLSGCNVDIRSSATVDDYNERGNERVVPKDATLALRNGRVTVPPHSLTFLTIE